MQFKVDDYVVHPIYGLGQIVEIEEREFSDEGTCLYYKISLPRRTVWIPVDAEESIGLRLATAKRELNKYRTVLQSRPDPLPQNHQQRHLELVKRLKEGSFRMVCEVVRDLTAWSQRRQLGQKDATTLQKTREGLYQEWATAAGVSVAEASQEIESLLQTTQQRSMG